MTPSQVSRKTIEGAEVICIINTAPKEGVVTEKGKIPLLQPHPTDRDILQLERYADSPERKQIVTIKGDWYLGKFPVCNVLKGDVQKKEITIRFFLSFGWNSAYLDLPLSNHPLLVFLKKYKDDTYSLVQSSGSLIELPDAPYNFSETADLQDKIKTILVQGLEKGDRRFAEDAVYILRQLDIPPDDLLSLYKDLTKKAKSDTKGLILEKRIALGDASVLDDILDISRDAKYAESVFVNSFEMTKLASPKNVRRFIELLSTQNQTFKEGAILTLAKMKEKSAIPHLIKALDDGNQNIRYRAVIGLAEITDRYQDFAPAIDLFCQNEKQYVQRWKNWWENEGKAEYEKTEK